MSHHSQDVRRMPREDPDPRERHRASLSGASRSSAGRRGHGSNSGTRPHSARGMVQSYFNHDAAEDQTRDTTAGKRDTTFDLGSESEESSDHRSAETQPIPLLWPKKDLTSRSTMQLFTIHSAEHKTFENKNEKIVLVCPSEVDGPKPEKDLSVNLRWLHVQNHRPLLDMESELEAVYLLENLVTECPFITRSQKTSALRTIRAEMVILEQYPNRYCGLSNLNCKDFISYVGASYVAPADISTAGGFSDKTSRETAARSLLSYSYGDDVVRQKDSSFGLRKLVHSFRPDRLCISRLVCFCVHTGGQEYGEELLITVSELGAAELRGDLIEIHDKASSGFHTIRVRGCPPNDDQIYPIVVDLDCNYTQFLRHAVAIAAPKDSDPTSFDILWAPNPGEYRKDPLTPAIWVQLLSRSEMEKYLFRLSRKSTTTIMWTGQSGVYGQAPNPAWTRKDPDPRSQRGETAFSSVSESNSETSSTRARRSYQGRHKSRNFAKEPAGREWERTERPDKHRAVDELGADVAQSLLTWHENENTAAKIPVADTTVVSADLDDSDSNLTVDWATSQSQARPQAVRSNAEASENEVSSTIQLGSPSRSPSPSRAPSRSLSPRIPLRQKKREALRAERAQQKLRRGGQSNNFSFDGSHKDYTKEGEGASPKSSGLLTFPCFTWRVKRGAGTVTDTSKTQDGNENVLRILAKINDSIMSDDSSHRTLYENAYRCTVEELVLRHPDLTAESGVSRASEGEQTGLGVHLEDERRASSRNEFDQGEEQPASDKEFDGLEDSLQSDLKLDNDEKPQSRQSLERPNPEKLIKKKLWDVSQTIFWNFFPKQGGSPCHDYYHPICERFWGALDNIFRQIRWSTTLSQGDLKCTIRNFDQSMSLSADMLGNTSRRNGQTFRHCQACQDSHVYNSPIDALNHLHNVHMECRAAERTDHLHDDPCSVWIAELDTPSIKEENVRILDAGDFMDSLIDVSGLLNDIQWLVAATAHDAQDTVPVRPRLPASLVYAFEHLISSYMFTSKYLSLRNKDLSQAITSRSRKFRLHQIETRCLEVRNKVTIVFANAKRDILLDGTLDGDEDTLGTRAVDADFLMAALITVVQNRSFEKSSQEITPMSSVTVSSQVIDTYKEYNKQIQLETNRRPQKRVFLAINEQEEELIYLRAVVYDHWQTLDRLWQWDDLYPGAANQFLQPQWQVLKLRISELDKLIYDVSVLKRRVVEMIGILEEDHGKAIRVFTVVTLFFLPMSFVTSFMGMNTNDIRNMDSNQNLFWAVAVPVTLVVLIAAFIYAYKGAEVSDALAQWLHSKLVRERREESEEAKEAVKLGPRRQQTWATMDSRDMPLEEDEEGRSKWAIGRKLLHRRRQARASEVEGNV